jgi:hypothetical protein
MARLIAPPHVLTRYRYPGGQARLNRNHILYGPKLRLAALALPGSLNTGNAAGGGCFYDYVTNKVSAIGSVNVSHSVMTPVGPAIYPTTASTFAAHWPAIPETMNELTMGCIVQVRQDSAGTQNMISYGANCLLSIYSDPLFIWFMNGGKVNLTFDVQPQLPQDGHCYFYAISYSTAAGSRATMVVNDLTSGVMSVSTHSSLNALAAGTSYTMLTEGAGGVPHNREAMGFIAAKFLNTKQLVDFASNPWDLVYERRVDRIIALSNIRGPSGGPAAPTNTGAPVITGSAGPAPTTLTVNPLPGGTWNGSPTGYNYQWKRNGISIAGAVGPLATSYTTVATTDFNAQIGVIVTATNAGGSGTSPISNQITVTALPVLQSSPTLSGSQLVTPGATTTIHCDHGNWLYSPTYSYVWKGNGITITSAPNSPDFVADNSYVGTTLTCVVTATNAAGPVTATATAGITITSGLGPPPTILVQPQITGLSQVGSTLHCDGGSWTGSPTLSYNWKRNGTVPVGTDSSNYQTHDPNDTNSNIGCVVIGTNTQASVTSQLSNQILVTPLPVVGTLPATLNIGIIALPPPSTLQAVQVQDSTGAWVTIGTINPATHIFTPIS